MVIYMINSIPILSTPTQTHIPTGKTVQTNCEVVGCRRITKNGPDNIISWGSVQEGTICSLGLGGWTEQRTRVSLDLPVKPLQLLAVVGLQPGKYKWESRGGRLPKEHEEVQVKEINNQYSTALSGYSKGSRRKERQNRMTWTLPNLDEVAVHGQWKWCLSVANEFWKARV